MMKKFLRVFILFSLCLLFCGFSDDEEKTRVFDSAGLLDSSELKQEEQSLEEQSAEDMVDYVFLSSSDLNGQTANQYVSDFIVQNQLGYNKADGNAAVLLIDVQKEEVWVVVNDELKEVILDEDTTNIINDILPYTKKEDFQGAIEVFAHDIHSRLEQRNWHGTQKVKQESTSSDLESDTAGSAETTAETTTEYDVQLYNSEENTNQGENGFLSNPFICMLIAAGLSAFIVIMLIRSEKTLMQAGADTYTSNVKVNPLTKQDIFLRTETAKIKKENKTNKT